jgi:hypothetical protein
MHHVGAGQESDEENSGNSIGSLDVVGIPITSMLLLGCQIDSVGALSRAFIMLP